jgi:hypothetical protein
MSADGRPNVTQNLLSDVHSLDACRAIFVLHRPTVVLKLMYGLLNCVRKVVCLVTKCMRIYEISWQRYKLMNGTETKRERAL